jgi:hypothetical protein
VAAEYKKICKSKTGTDRKKPSFQVNLPEKTAKLINFFAQNILKRTKKCQTRLKANAAYLFLM